MWSIVIFNKDNKCAAVPSHWFNNGQCAWPKVTTKNRSKLLEIRKVPNEFDFDYFPARLLHTEKPIESLSEAREKARKAKITSDLSSTEEETPHRRPNKRINCTSNSIDIIKKKKTYEPIPLFTSKPKKNDNSDSELDDSIDDITYSPTKSNLDNHEDGLFSSSEEKVVTPTPEQNKLHTKNIKTKKQLFNSEEYSSPQAYNNELIQTFQFYDEDFQPLQPQNNPNSTSAVFIPSGSNTSDKNDQIHENQGKTFEDFQKFVKTSLTNIKYEVKVLSYSLEAIKSMVAEVQESIKFGSVNEEVYESDHISWPISNLVQLNEVENKLKDAKVQCNEVLLLSRLVGDSISETVRRMMSRLFDDQLTKQFSFIGFKGKNKFNGLNCCKLLFDSIHKSKKFTNISEKEIATCVAKWMAQASNRISKKLEKEKKNTNE